MTTTANLNRLLAQQQRIAEQIERAKAIQARSRKLCDRIQRIDGLYDLEDGQIIAALQALVQSTRAAAAPAPAPTATTDTE
jgi:hypothetical protein